MFGFCRAGSIIGVIIMSFVKVVYFSAVSWVNPLTPRSDQHETSPYNILTLSSKQVMRINSNLSAGSCYLDVRPNSRN